MKLFGEILGVLFVVLFIGLPVLALAVVAVVVIAHVVVFAVPFVLGCLVVSFVLRLLGSLFR